MRINIQAVGAAILILVIINLLILTGYFSGHHSNRPKAKANNNNNNSNNNNSNNNVDTGLLIDAGHYVINDGTASMFKWMSNTSLVRVKAGHIRQSSEYSTQLIDGRPITYLTPNQLKRQERLRSSCRASVRDDNLKLYPINYRDHLFVVDSMKVVFCLVPKVGSTNWKKVLLKLSDNYDSVQRYETIHRNPFLRTLKTYADVDVEKILAQYTKVLIVRHPFSRILSAYKDKLERVDKQFKFRNRLIPKIIQRYRQRGQQFSSDTVTFQEFVRYLTDPTVSFEHAAEEHWREIYRMCAPCKLRYDIIGKLETIDEDASLIMKSIGTDLRYPTPSPIFSTNASNELERYYSTLSGDELNALRQRYRFDFNLFDYKQELPS